MTRRTLIAVLAVLVALAAYAGANSAGQAKTTPINARFWAGDGVWLVQQRGAIVLTDDGKETMRWPAGDMSVAKSVTCSGKVVFPLQCAIGVFDPMTHSVVTQPISGRVTCLIVSGEDTVMTHPRMASCAKGAAGPDADVTIQ